MVNSSASFLSHEFLKKYEGLQPKNKGILFEVLHLRTYSRWIPEKKRRETWLETVQRVVEYNVSLYQGPNTRDELVEEAELMFDKVFNLEVLPAGRSLWIGGTEAVQKHPESSFNCSALVIKKLDDFCDIFHLLLCGCGVGYRILKEDVNNLPLLNTNFNINHYPYEPKHPSIREESTTCEKYLGFEQETLEIEIGDSKQAWVESLRIVLHALASTTNKRLNINISYNSIRPSGERIKTFGGIAPGPSGLVGMYSNLEKLIKSSEGIITPVLAMDIANTISMNVIVGGTRRSALIALGDPTDKEFIEAKKNLYTQIDGKWVKDESKSSRSMSNNSVVYKETPTLDCIREIFSNIKHNGEPGFFNLASALKRRPNANTANPCLEILLDNYGVCNLSTVVLPSHLENGSINHKKLEESVRLATRIGMRQTNVTLSLKHWDETQKRDRLTGVSMTGFMDTVDALGLKFNSRTVQLLLESMNHYANVEADSYAFNMRIPRPLLVTAIKPEGSLSLLPTVSPGLHRSYAPYYIRRVRVSSLDPVCNALKELGVPWEDDITKKNSGRVVFSFPIASGATISANDEPALDQFNRYLQMQSLYTDHNSSCTLTVGDSEWDSISRAVHENWDNIVACAFLPKDCSSYPQMPLEALTKEQYDEMISKFPTDLGKLYSLVNKYEVEKDDSEEPLEAVDCSTGACPVR